MVHQWEVAAIVAFAPPAPDGEEMFMVAWAPTTFESLEEAENNIAYHNGNGYVENGTFTVHWNPTAERRSFLVPPMGRASDMLNDFVANNAPDA